MDLLRTHQENATFLLLGKSRLTIRITDAPTIWYINKDILFHTGYRIAGLSNEIITMLKELNLDTNSIDSILSTCLTYKNHNSEYESVYIQEQNHYYTVLSNSITKSKVKDEFDDIYKNIDIFDFVTYKADFDLLSNYYTGVELYLRTAIWIGYKYARLTTEAERKELMEDFYYNKIYTKIYSDNPNFAHNTSDIHYEDGVNDQIVPYKVIIASYTQRTNTKEWLDIMTGVFEGYQLMYSFFKHFKPNSYKEKVKLFYGKYQHHLEAFFNRAYRRYVDANHVDQDLWF